MLRQLRAVQLDTISVLARSHELVAYSRLGPIDRTAIEDAYWGGPPFGSFEYWAHAACVVPMEDWPHYAFKREAARARGRRWHWLEEGEKTCREILRRLEADGPLTANELGGAKKGGPWWDWSETKIGVEWLLDLGEVVCAKRKGFQRVYDLPDRAVPAEALSATRSPDDQMRHLLTGAMDAMGVATARDAAVYCGIKPVAAARLLDEMDLAPVAVEGWDTRAWAVPSLVDAPTRKKRREVLISPFDSLVWDRDRTERLFGFRHRLEAYTPKPKRVHGYYSMPVLVGDTLVGRVDPGRDGTTFVAKGVHIEPSSMSTKKGAIRTAEAVARAIGSAASWVGSENVRLEWVTPAEARSALQGALDQR